MTLQQLFMSMHAGYITGSLREDMAKAQLLWEIEAAAKTTAVRLENDPSYIMGTVFPRGRARFRWRGREVRIWRLALAQPFWLGEDGVIYEGCDIDTWDGWDYPQYLLSAELRLSDVEELQGIFGAARGLKPSA